MPFCLSFLEVGARPLTSFRVLWDIWPLWEDHQWLFVPSDGGLWINAETVQVFSLGEPSFDGALFSVASQVLRKGQRYEVTFDSGTVQEHMLTPQKTIHGISDLLDVLLSGYMTELADLNRPGCIFLDQGSEILAVGPPVSPLESGGLESIGITGATPVLSLQISRDPIPFGSL